MVITEGRLTVTVRTPRAGAVTTQVVDRLRLAPDRPRNRSTGDKAARDERNGFEVPYPMLPSPIFKTSVCSEESFVDGVRHRLEKREGLRGFLKSIFRGPRIQASFMSRERRVGGARGV